MSSEESSCLINCLSTNVGSCLPEQLHTVSKASLTEHGRQNTYLMRMHAVQMLSALHGQDHILMECTFPGDYPNKPFFLRIISPRMCWYTGNKFAAQPSAKFACQLSDSKGYGKYMA